MKNQRKIPDWRIGFALFCVVYVVWVVYLSLNNIDMVNSRYRRAVARLQPRQIERIARDELVEECRRQAKREGRYRQGRDLTTVALAKDCLEPPAGVLAERVKTVAERLVLEKKRTVRKMLLFYGFFGIVFLVLPPLILYLLISFGIWIYRNIQIVK